VGTSLLIVAYALCFAYVLFISLYIILYAVTYGPNVTEKWLGDFFRAFIFDAIFFDPISLAAQGIIVAPFVALVVKPNIKKIMDAMKSKKKVHPGLGEIAQSAVGAVEGTPSAVEDGLNKPSALILALEDGLNEPSSRDPHSSSPGQVTQESTGRKAQLPPTAAVEGPPTLSGRKAQLPPVAALKGPRD